MPWAFFVPGLRPGPKRGGLRVAAYFWALGRVGMLTLGRCVSMVWVGMPPTLPFYSVENLWIIVCVYVSPGRRTTVGKSGLFGESG